MRSPWTFCCAFLFLATAIVPVHAQGFGGVDNLETNTPYFFRYRPGEPVMQVWVWGAGVRQGIYEVSRDIELDALLTIAGGATLPPEGGTQRQIIEVRVLRDEAEGRVVVYEARIEDLLTDTASYPNLQDGDVVVVEAESRRRWTFLSTISFIGSIGSTILVADRLIRILSN